ncbi:MAG: YraN family protein [Deltaproteobacteria bacterium]|nr:YraN family protein [Deltaproteobacteria bacterium]
MSAERRVEDFLASAGYRVVERNFRWRGGEIDLVATDARGELVFVEVRSAAARSPWLRYTISAPKRRRLVATAQRYLLARRWARRAALRFDVVWVEAQRLEHWKNVAMV